MNNLKCLIIEDQLPAQRILKGYIEQVEYLDLVGIYLDPIKAMYQLEENSIDVLFLDIHLPKISGISFLKSLNHSPFVIITTAFSEYAVEGFEYNVVDYLLKPFAFNRFLKAVSKINRLVKDEHVSLREQTIFIKTKGIIQKINIQDILYIESKGDFVLLHTSNGNHIASTSLQNIIRILGMEFTRSHKSYAVRLNSIDKIIGNTIKISSYKIPIGRTYREELIRRLKAI